MHIKFLAAQNQSMWTQKVEHKNFTKYRTKMVNRIKNNIFLPQNKHVKLYKCDNGRFYFMNKVWGITVTSLQSHI